MVKSRYQKPDLLTPGLSTPRPPQGRPFSHAHVTFLRVKWLQSLTGRFGDQVTARRIQGSTGRSGGSHCSITAEVTVTCLPSLSSHVAGQTQQQLVPRSCRDV